MSRKSKIEPVREYLSRERSDIIVKIDDAIKAEDFYRAAQFKAFRVVLSRAIALCGEDKPREVTDGNDRGV